MILGKLTGQMFDVFTPLVLSLFDSEYLNFGYWNKKGLSFKQAQSQLVDLFGRFSKLKENTEVIDVGFGTGEQDLYFVDHFSCKKIVGLNVSKFQVGLALNKIKTKQKYSRAIEFIWEDGMNLVDRRENSFDRVLALESAQQFEDKQKFFMGAYHVLRNGGYLCILEAIPKNKSAYAFNEDYSKEIEKELGKVSKEAKNYKSLVKERMEFIFDCDKSTMEKKRFYNILHDQYLTLIEKTGFSIEKTQDISKEALEFFPKTTKKILKILLKDAYKNKIEQDVLLNMLTITLIRYFLLKNNLSEYLLIRAEK